MTITTAARPMADAPGPRPSRAAILAGAVLVAGCHAQEPAPVYGGPPEPTPTVETAAPPDASPADAMPPVTTAPDSGATPDAATHPVHPRHASPPVPAYGGPPPFVPGSSH